MVDATTNSNETKSYQSRWRLAGALSLAVAALLAAASLWTGILRDSVIHAVRIFAQNAPQDVTAHNGLIACLLYWSIFVLALCASLYLAFIDMRYIRLQYALEKQKLFRQSLGDELASTALDKKRDP